jgi:formamidopyrimidine-DNA glycosylase
MVSPLYFPRILYQARIHPACPIPHLTHQNVIDLHKWIRKIPEIAVSVNADHQQFPEDWLFRWRWSKGKKQKNRVEADVKRKAAKGKGQGQDKEGGEDGDGESEVDAEAEGEEITPKGKQFFALVGVVA